MNPKQKTQTLQAAYLLGAAIDAIAATQLTIPNLWQTFYSLPTQTNPTLNFALLTAAGLMWGWTALLLWAYRKPIQRRTILLITAFPVIFTLTLNNIYAYTQGLISIQTAAPTLTLQCALAAFMVFSYFNAPKEAQ